MATTKIKRLYLNNEAFVPITLAEAVVVNTTNLPGIAATVELITTLDNVLRQTNTTIQLINDALASKQDKLTAGTGIDIADDGTISITGFSALPLYTIVQELPTASVDCLNQIYIVLNNTNANLNSYDEYICVKKDETYVWEKLGTIQSTVDLSTYVQKSELNTEVTTIFNQLGGIRAEPITISTGAAVVVNYEIPQTLYNSLVSPDDSDKITSQ